MIDHPRRFLFVHVPKTGGTSIELAFDPEAERRNVRRKHWTARQYRRRYPIRFRRYFKLALVRNPWDLVLSQYRYLWHSGHEWPRRWRARTRIPLEWSFAEWLKSEPFQRSSPRSPSLAGRGRPAQQLDWITDRQGRVIVDHVGRFEGLAQEFEALCARLGLEALPLGHALRSERGDYRSYYDAPGREIVARKYSRDIDFFGYRF